jgi:hypothetical protein
MASPASIIDLLDYEYDLAQSLIEATAKLDRQQAWLQAWVERSYPYVVAVRTKPIGALGEGGNHPLLYDQTAFEAHISTCKGRIVRHHGCMLVLFGCTNAGDWLRLKMMLSEE